MQQEDSKPLKLPPRVGLVNYRMVYSQKRPPLDDRFKLRLRTKAKKLKTYHTRVEVGVSGRTDSGNPVPVDTLGKWLFGVPGYQGHIRCIPYEDRLEILLCLPDEPPARELILDLVRHAAENLGLEQVREESL